MENELPVIDGIEWQPWVTRNMSFWHQCLSVEGSYKHQRDFGVNSKFDYLSFTINGIHTSAFGYAENLREMGVAVLEAVNSDDKIAVLEKKYVTYGDELRQALQVCLKNLSADNWENFIRLYRRYTAGLIIPTMIGRQGSELLMRKLIGAGIREKDIENTVNVITYPSKHTPLFDSRLGLLEIGSNVQSDSASTLDTDKALQSWVEKYGHIPVNFCDEPWSMADARKQLKSVMQIDCVTELEKLRRNHETKVAAAKETLEQIDNGDTAVLARALQAGTSLNEYRKNVFSWISLHYRPLFAKVADMAGLGSWRDCFYLYPHEMARVLQGKELPTREMISTRSVIAIKMKDDELIELEREQVLVLQGFVQWYQGQSSVEIGEMQEVRGVVANKGNMRGVVKVILSSKDFHKIVKGDILVTTMTSVDFVPVMEKAAAFVTNEGGITSHAAIVAREMNKPCIIGTKIATQVLKDGDLVEVDADKGIIRKL